jgi:hypothetical protein
VKIGEGELERIDGNFPLVRFRWNETHEYEGCEIDHLWFSKIIGKHAYGNLLVTWWGPMDVKLENVRDQTERLEWEGGTRIRGPDLFHLVAEFPQIGNDLVLMYSLQAMLCDTLTTRLLELGLRPKVKGTDIFVGGGKLNVGICSATPTSCTMHFGVNITLEGEPSIPDGVVACGLADLLGGDVNGAVKLIEESVAIWAGRIEDIHVKAYKTR